MKNCSKVFSTLCAKDCGPRKRTCTYDFMWAVFLKIVPKFFLNLYRWRIKFTDETCQKIIVSVFLTMKATILDTRGSTALPLSKIKHEFYLFNLFYRKRARRRKFIITMSWISCNCNCISSDCSNSSEFLMFAAIDSIRSWKYRKLKLIKAVVLYVW